MWFSAHIPTCGESAAARNTAEGPVLAVLAMLARKGAAARGSGRLRSSLPPVFRAAALASPGRGGKAVAPIERESCFQAVAVGSDASFPGWADTNSVNHVPGRTGSSPRMTGRGGNPTR